jgi:ribosomal protein L37AE/L43A
MLNSNTLGYAACPCCADRLLRHVRKRQLYWFCSSCHLEIPLSTLEEQTRSSDNVLSETLIGETLLTVDSQDAPIQTAA